MTKAGIDGRAAKALLQHTAITADKLKRQGEADPYGAAARKLSEKLKDKAAKDRSDAIRNSMIRDGIMKDVHANGFKNAALSIEAAMVNINTPMGSSHAPLEEAGQGMAFRWLTALEVELHKIGMDKVLATGEMDDRLAEELWKISQVGPKKPPTDKIGQAAYLLHGPLHDAGERLRGAGAKFDHAIDYITRTKHNPRAMLDEGFEGWWKKTEARLHDKTFDDLEPLMDEGGNVIETPAETKLRFADQVYRGLTTGIHGVHGRPESLSMDGDVYIPPAFEGTRNLAKSLSHERVLYWKDSASWMDHMREFGGMTTLGRTVHETLATASRHTALMERFGTNPMGSLKMIIRQVQEHYRDIVDPEEMNKFTAKSKHLENVMAQLDGSASMPHSKWANDLVNSMKNIENASMLGAVGLTHFSALPVTMGSIGTPYDMGRFELFGNNVMSLLRGAAPGEGQDILAEAGAFYHGSLSHFYTQFKKAQTVPGRISAMAAIILKMTGLNYILENSQNGFRYMLMHKIGRELDHPYSELAPILRDNLNKYQIGEREWALLQGAREQMHVVEGRRYATPKDFERLDDAAIDKHNEEPINQIKKGVEERRQAYADRDAQEKEWVDARVKRLEDSVKAWRDKIDEWSEYRDFKKSELWLGSESKVEEMQERIKEAKATQRAARHVQSMRTADEVKAWTDEVRHAMENERQRLGQEGYEDGATEELFNDIVHEEVKGAKEGQTKAVKEGDIEQEKLATKYGRFLARSERKIRQYRSAAEEKIKEIEGRRLSDIERFKKTSRMKTDKTPAEKLGLDDVDTRWFTERVKDADEQMREFEGRSEARIWERAERLEAMERAVPEQIAKMRQKTRWQLADNYSAFVTHAGREATVAAGAREKAWAAPITGTGALGHMMMQFKAWPLAVMNQVWGREWYANQTRGGRALNIFALLGLSMAGGMFRMMIRDATNGVPIRDPRDPATMAAALTQGGGVGLLGDFLFGETNRMGGGLLDTLAGPVIGDAAHLFKIFTRFRDDTYKIGEDTHHGRGAYADVWPDLIHFTKGHIPFANMIGLKGATDYLLWHHLYEAVSPGYWERMNQRMLKERGRQMAYYKMGAGVPAYPWDSGSYGFLGGR
jgi:hypothetical protein